MDKKIIKEVVLEQKSFLKKAEKGIERKALSEIKKFFDSSQVVVIAGLRRTGKSTLLYQIMDIFPKKGYYFNFEDERLMDFSVDDFNSLYEVLIEVYGKRKTFFLDEIQNVEGWERFVRRMSDQGFKFFITGSNASLLSRELGTKLTGRHLTFNMYPFSFAEYLKFNDLEFSQDDFLSAEKKGMIKRHFNKYLKEGGLPEYLKYGNIESLKKVYDDIIYRDIVVRYDIKEVKTFRELALYLLSNFTKLFSYRSLGKFLGLGSSTTVKNYIDYLENSFLFFVMDMYSDSLKSQSVSPKKAYCIDNGLINHIAFKISQDKGRFLENLVFLELKRRNKELYYYKTKKDLEVDFLVREGREARELVQVTWNLDSEDTKKRELTSLLQAMDELSLKKGVILTNDESDDIKVGNKKITVRPVYQWLLEGK